MEPITLCWEVPQTLSSRGWCGCTQLGWPQPQRELCPEPSSEAWREAWEHSLDPARECGARPRGRGFLDAQSVCPGWPSQRVMCQCAHNTLLCERGPWTPIHTGVHTLGSMCYRDTLMGTLCVSMLVAQLCPNLFNPWTVARQALLSMGFSRQEY